DEEASFGWPGSFRPPPTSATIPATTPAAASSAVNSGSYNLGGSVVVQAADDEPDLTLRL
uniref:Uncharacterized protein n=2 Tax=Oryza brachyantha TaxID=4533 RepID=J3LLT9_ORYBR